MTANQTSDDKPDGIDEINWGKLKAVLYRVHAERSGPEHDSAIAFAARMIVEHGLLDKIAANPNMLNATANTVLLNEALLANREYAQQNDALQKENARLRNELYLKERFKAAVSGHSNRIVNAVPEFLRRSFKTAAHFVGGPIAFGINHYVNKNDDEWRREWPRNRPSVFFAGYCGSTMMAAAFWFAATCYDFYPIHGIREQTLKTSLDTLCTTKMPDLKSNNLDRASFWIPCDQKSTYIDTKNVTPIFGYVTGPYFIHKTIKVFPAKEALYFSETNSVELSVCLKKEGRLYDSGTQEITSEEAILKSGPDRWTEQNAKCVPASQLEPALKAMLAQ